jgi:hypothetical protein
MEIDIVSKIDSMIQKEIDSKEHRQYLGASILGEDCDRKIWYMYKKPKHDHDPRIQRIFDFGNMMEEYLIKLLQKSGFALFTHDEDGKQYGFDDYPIMGSSDGVIILNDIPHLLEFKSYNEKRFNTLMKEGVKSSDPIYYSQVCVYMEKMELDKCLFMAICKNDSRIYTEIVGSDPIEANYCINKGHEIAKMETEPNRRYDSKSHFKCKLCSYRKECWADV